MTSDLDQSGLQLSVSSLMARDPVTIQADSSLSQVAETLADHDVSGMPVVDRGGALVGVVSQTDIVRLRAGSIPTSGWHGLLVRDVMTHPAITVPASASLKEAAGLMTEHHVHRLVVVAEPASIPIGVISESDLIREVAALSAED
ncbi:MAG: CBS domain-containing protein [Acidimicrobiia bacterium]|nr:CBS domain-containing protein [Acidimicrobiia bacterium]